ncbi:Zinc finger CCHC domain-containing protein 4 [Trichinella papuae]|uniref:Zinc finger CCHC domain-containing protein 4 n=1 Tax=Trichinella papuae TaxID=268474 RepID=A0A0V1MJZ5_9BILA|nr:Zinc finger CCHC domain-containing protein 4 [Trichinella papuae]
MAENSTDTRLHVRPYCIHGPCLKFCRKRKNRKIYFFACSVCRDRKKCSFYWPVEKKFPKQKVVEMKKKIQMQRRFKPMEAYRRLCKVEQNEQDRQFCFTCGQFVLPEERSKHAQHKLKFNITNRLLNRPCMWLTASKNEKKEAQYWFSDSSAKFLAKLPVQLSFDHVLCIGTPRVHEELLHLFKSKASVKSFLLDYDERFEQFWPPSRCAQYNLFANYVFTKTGRNYLKKFLKKSTKLLIIVDPPFGGLTSAIGKSLISLQKIFHKLHMNDTSDVTPKCEIIWIFPYFMEKKIIQACPNLKMLDYIVGVIEYKNHPNFKANKSPIRIFTSLSPADVVLPTNDARYRYALKNRFCPHCNKFVIKTNLHCKICNSCTSKNGRAYNHCISCNRCVKLTFTHCETCGRCHLPNCCAVSTD